MPSRRPTVCRAGGEACSSGVPVQVEASSPLDRLHPSTADARLRSMTSIRAPRVRAPELVGAGGWLNTGGRALSISELRGKIVLLDFWTFCCINCLHVADELRPLQDKYADVLVVIGVHSPKFVHEADHAAVEAAVERYGIG